MTTSLVNIKSKPTPHYDIYIGRANKWLSLQESKWHNPFALRRESDRQKVIDQYKEYILGRPDLLECLHELDDKVLGCYCYPKKCHGNILIELREKQKCAH